MKLVLARSCKTAWSEENKFMGWTDVPLSANGIEEAHKLGKRVAKLNIDFSIAFTSVLSRNKETLKYIEEETGKTYKKRESYLLNPKHYGVLEGMNKEEAKNIYGEDVVAKWRRGFTEKAPEISISDERFPGNDSKYDEVLKFKLPLSESQKDVYDRVVEYFESEISTFLRVGEDVLIVASGSVLRVLTKYLEDIPDEKMSELEMPSGTLVVYDFDDELKAKDKSVIE